MPSTVKALQWVKRDGVRQWFGEHLRTSILRSTMRSTQSLKLDRMPWWFQTSTMNLWSKKSWNKYQREFNGGSWMALSIQSVRWTILIYSLCSLTIGSKLMQKTTCSRSTLTKIFASLLSGQSISQWTYLECHSWWTTIPSTTQTLAWLASLRIQPHKSLASPLLISRPLIINYQAKVALIKAVKKQVLSQIQATMMQDGMM